MYASAKAIKMTPKTWAYLSDVIGDSFKREVDLDESVWRTLPFFVAAFGLAITLLSYISDATRQLSSLWASIMTYSLFAASVAAFAWAFRWFWSVVSPLEYQYPPSDEDLLTYSDGLTEYHRQVGLTGDALDEAVATDMKAFVTSQLAAASGKNRTNNAIRVLARSQAILFLMIAFGLAILSEAIIFMDSRIYADEETSNARVPEHGSQTARAAEGPPRGRGSQDHEGNFVSTQGYQGTMSDSGQDGGTPKTPAQSQPQRPQAPAPQILKKNEDRPPSKPR
jgi:hypothetical protein